MWGSGGGDPGGSWVEAGLRRGCRAPGARRDTDLGHQTDVTVMPEEDLLGLLAEDMGGDVGSLGCRRGTPRTGGKGDFADVIKDLAWERALDGPGGPAKKCRAFPGYSRGEM